MNPNLVALTAFTIVMAMMLLLTVVFFALGYFGRRRPRARAADTTAVPPEKLDPQLVAVLAAAAHAALGVPVRIHRVHVQRPSSMDTWSRAGRLDIMVSHRVEPKR